MQVLLRYKSAIIPHWTWTEKCFLITAARQAMLVTWNDGAEIWDCVALGSIHIRHPKSFDLISFQFVVELDPEFVSDLFPCIVEINHNFGIKLVFISSPSRMLLKLTLISVVFHPCAIQQLFDVNNSQSDLSSHAALVSLSVQLLNKLFQYQ